MKMITRMIPMSSISDIWAKADHIWAALLMVRPQWWCWWSRWSHWRWWSRCLQSRCLSQCGLFETPGWWDDDGIIRIKMTTLMMVMITLIVMIMTSLIFESDWTLKLPVDGTGIKMVMTMMITTNNVFYQRYLSCPADGMQTWRWWWWLHW